MSSIEIDRSQFALFLTLALLLVTPAGTLAEGIGEWNLGDQLPTNDSEWSCRQPHPENAPNYLMCGSEVEANKFELREDSETIEFTYILKGRNGTVESVEVVNFEYIAANWEDRFWESLKNSQDNLEDVSENLVQGIYMAEAFGSENGKRIRYSLTTGRDNIEFTISSVKLSYVDLNNWLKDQLEAEEEAGELVD